MGTPCSPASRVGGGSSGAGGTGVDRSHLVWHVHRVPQLQLAKHADVIPLCAAPPPPCWQTQGSLSIAVVLALNHLRPGAAARPSPTCACPVAINPDSAARQLHGAVTEGGAPQRGGAVNIASAGRTDPLEHTGSWCARASAVPTSCSTGSAAAQYSCASSCVSLLTSTDENETQHPMYHAASHVSCCWRAFKAQAHPTVSTLALAHPAVFIPCKVILCCQC